MIRARFPESFLTLRHKLYLKIDSELSRTPVLPDINMSADLIFNKSQIREIRA